ncbi:MAG TPA: xanthine dehydrogenase family protein molybdopterin-binding subunit [Nakamurella sp.]
MTTLETRAPLHRVEGRQKVTGAARYAAEYQAADLAYAWPVVADIAAGRVTDVDTSAVETMPGVLQVWWCGNAPRLVDVGMPMLAVLQTDEVHFRGEIVALVVASTLEVAREAAERLPVGYVERPHEVLLRADDPALRTPETVNAGYPGTTEKGDPETAFATSPVRVDATFRTPGQHNNPMEPHATTAVFADGELTLYDSNQGGHPVRQAIAGALGMPVGRVRVISTHVGGGFGSKGLPRPQVILAALAARELGRPVRMVLARQQLFSLVGYRSPTIQRVRLGADTDGRLRSIDHDAIVQTARHVEFVEQVTVATRTMYAAENRRTRHRVAALDVPIPSWMRAPGECPGMFALESAMDELAVATGVDPIELRIRNEPRLDPEREIEFSSRDLVGCLRRGAELFGWAERDPRPRSRRQGRWLIGSGVAASTYPVYASPATATATAAPDGGFVVSINATDIGTGARTALLVLAAEALGTDPERVEIRIGDSDLPRAGGAGGSSGTTSWGWAVHKVCSHLRDEVAARGPGAPATEMTVTADTSADVKALGSLSRHAYGAQFAQAWVDTDTGEVRVPRMVGVFAAGRIVNPRTARSQLIGGMTMGLSMALHEEGMVDAAYGGYANHDLAGYHVASCADVVDIEADWLDERDSRINPLGTKGIGEIGIVGTAAAVANAVYNATGVRVRELPITIEDLLGAG